MKPIANTLTKTTLGCALLSAWLLAACGGGAGGGVSPPPAPQRKDTVHHVRLKATSPSALAILEQTWVAASQLCPNLMAQKPKHEVFRQWEDIYYGAGATAVHVTNHKYLLRLEPGPVLGTTNCVVIEEKTHTIRVYTPAGLCEYDVMTGSGGKSADGLGCGKPFDVFVPTQNTRSNGVRETDRTLTFGVESCKVFDSTSAELNSRLKLEECVQLRDDVYVANFQGGVGGLLLNVVGDGNLLGEMTLEKIDRDRKLLDLHSIFPRSVADLPKP